MPSGSCAGHRPPCCGCGCGCRCRCCLACCCRCCLACCCLCLLVCGCCGCGCCSCCCCCCWDCGCKAGWPGCICWMYREPNFRIDLSLGWLDSIRPAGKYSGNVGPAVLSEKTVAAAAVRTASVSASRPHPVCRNTSSASRHGWVSVNECGTAHLPCCTTLMAIRSAAAHQSMLRKAQPS